MPNGIAVMDNGAALVADSFGARLWHVDAAGQARVWLEHPLLQPRAYLGRFPGPNGVQVWNGSAYVAVSDRGHIVRVPITPAHGAGEPQVLHGDVAADDFAIDTDGTMYFATHPFDTIVRIDAAGKRSILAGVEQGLTGPTALALAPGSAGGKLLYAVTDGGLYRQPGAAPIPLPAQVPGLYRLSLP
jgi:sugar lactone lactonase YvrE